MDTWVFYTTYFTHTPYEILNKSFYVQNFPFYRYWFLTYKFMLRCNYLLRFVYKVNAFIPPYTVHNIHIYYNICFIVYMFVLEYVQTAH